MSRRSFQLWSIILVVTIVSFVAVFPYLLVLLVRASSCERVGGACGAVAAIVGMTLKPLGIYALELLLLLTFSRRARSLGLGWGWTFLIFIWLLVMSGYLIAARNFWGANFGLGLIDFPPPVFLLFCLIFFVFLNLKTIPSAAEGGSPRLARIGWTIAIVAAIHSVLSVAFGLVVYELLLFVPIPQPFLHSLLKIEILASRAVDFGLQDVPIRLIDAGAFAVGLIIVVLAGRGSDASSKLQIASPQPQRAAEPS